MALTGCCGCHNLKRGSVAIGITLIVLSAVGILWNSGALIHAAANGVHLGRLATPVGVMYLIYLITITFNALLIAGVRHGSRGMILSWIVYHGIMFTLCSLFVFGGIIAVIVFSSRPDTPPIAVNICVVVLVAVAAFNAAEWYWFAVVVSHMNELDEGSLGFAYTKHVDPPLVASY